MAIGNINDAVLHPELATGAFRETIDQNIQVWNEASGNALQFMTQSLQGDYEKTRFPDFFVDGVSRRDDTSTSSVASQKMSMLEKIDPKLKRRTEPYENTVDFFRSMNMSPEELSVLFGEQAAQQVGKDYLNTALLALESALAGESDVYIDKTGAGSNTLEHSYLNEGLGAFGDRREALSVIVMHSKAFEDLIDNNISSAGDQTEFATIYQETPGSFGRRVVVTDSDSLVTTDGITTGTDSYSTLLLQPEAVRVTESDEFMPFEEGPITGQENVTRRLQAEYAFNLDMKAFTWDETNGGRNPDDSTISTASNWDTLWSNKRDLPGVVIEHA